VKLPVMMTAGTESAEFLLPLDLPPMEARLVEDLPEDPGWQFEPKWDGFRCLAFRAGDQVELRAKSGKPLARYFPEMAAALRRLEQSRFGLMASSQSPSARRSRSMRCRCGSTRLKAASESWRSRHRRS
jgi:hypothetical protein